MFSYKGVKCPICQKEFSESDDIVVCPECGAPYHRTCYQQAGHCVMEQLHAEGRDWENPNTLQEKSVSRPSALLCPHCGAPSDADAPMCTKCGLPLQRKEEKLPSEFPGIQMPQGLEENGDTSTNPKYESYKQLYSAISIHDLIGGVPVKDLISFCQSNYLYFLRVFKMLSVRINSIMFNWSAFFLNFVYFFYRKMYKTGFVVLGILLLSYAPSFMLAYHLVPQVLENSALLSTLAFDFTGLENLLLLVRICGYVPMSLSLACGFLANRQYYRHAMNNIQRLRQQYGENELAYQKALLAKGGVSPQAVVAVILSLMGIVFCTSIIMAFSITL